MAADSELDDATYLLARETVGVLSPDDVENFDLLFERQQKPYAGQDSASIGLGLEALAGTFLVIVYPVLLACLKGLAAAGLLIVEDKAKEWLASKFKSSEISPQLRISEKGTLPAILQDVRTFVMQRGFTEDQADALEGVLLRRIVIQ